MCCHFGKPASEEQVNWAAASLWNNVIRSRTATATLFSDCGRFHFMIYAFSILRFFLPNRPRKQSTQPSTFHSKTCSKSYKLWLINSSLYWMVVHSLITIGEFVESLEGWPFVVQVLSCSLIDWRLLSLMNPTTFDEWAGGRASERWGKVDMSYIWHWYCKHQSPPPCQHENAISN